MEGDWSAWAGVVGGAIGGSLVLLGDWAKRRFDRRRAWHAALHQRAAELLRVEWSRAKLAESIHGGNPHSEDADNFLEAERRAAASYLFVTPGAHKVRDAATSLMSSTSALLSMSTANDDAWEDAHSAYLSSRADFQDAVTATLRA